MIKLLKNLFPVLGKFLINTWQQCKANFALVIILVILLNTGCSDNGSPTGPEDITGTYILISINDSSLPWISWDEPGYRGEVLSGSIKLEQLTWFLELEMRETYNNEVETYTASDSGPYIRDGNQLVFLDMYDHATGVIEGNILTITIKYTEVGWDEAVEITNVLVFKK